MAGHGVRHAIVAALVHAGLVTSCSSPPPVAATDLTGHEDGGLHPAPPPSDDAAVPPAFRPEGGTVDGGVSPSHEWVSGRRLRANVLVATPDVELFTSWHDTELDADCAFRSWNDGLLRCVPLAAAALAYTEATCTLAAYVDEAPCAAAPPRVVSAAVTACEPPKIVRVGAKIAPAMLYRSDNLGCMPIGPPPSGRAVYDASVAVTSDELLEARITREPRGPILAVDVVRAPDGAIEARAIADTALGAHCQLDVTGAIPTRCVPEAAASGTFFSDAACATPIASAAVALQGTPFCGELPGAVVTSPARCEDGLPALAGLGRQVTRQVYTNVGAACASAGISPPGTTYWEILGALPPSTFAPFTSVDEGEGAVRVRALLSATGERLVGAAFYDIARAAPCRKEADATGALRCIPLDAAAVAAYADGACGAPLVAADTGCAAPAIAVVPRSDGCGRMDLLAVGAKAAVTTVYTGTPGACSPSAADVARAYYEVGAALDPSTFPLLTSARE